MSAHRQGTVRFDDALARGRAARIGKDNRVVAEPKPLSEMIGKALREIGVLVFVFLSLDGQLEERMSIPASLVVTIVIAVGAFIGGALVERRGASKNVSVTPRG